MRIVVGALLLSLVAGCAAPPLYHWGHYEGLVYSMYARPGAANPEVQIEQLSRDVAEAAAAGRPVPPGVHLHLGHMYLLQGNRDAARREMEIEKRLFPESATFVDRLLAGTVR